MKNKTWCSFIFVMVFLVKLQAQDITPYKFGKITAADFNIPTLAFDSGANAVIISDIGSTSFEGNIHGYFTLVYTHYMRVKIINKNGLDIGTRQINIFHNADGEYEKLSSIRGSTFNLENGVVQQTVLDEKSVFNEKYNNDIDRKKFTMPALKEGSVFDLEYTIKSPFSERLRSWTFQGEYPRLWSEYVVTIPPPLHYVMSMKGDNQFTINSSKDVFKNYTIRASNGSYSDEAYNISGSSISKRWVKKDVPALHEEAFTTTLDNYNAEVSFQLKYIQWTAESERHENLSTWSQTAKTLLASDEFGLVLTHENGWMSDELKSVISGATSDEDKARRIFYYVQNNFKTVGKEGYAKEGLYVQGSLKDVFKKKEGNVAEVNLLLMAMLNKANIVAEPIILSTRDNGIASVNYPLIGEYNYVVCIAYPGNKTVILDASDPFNGYGHLPGKCYNGFGHIMNAEKPLPVEFSADSLWESSLTSVRIYNDDKGKSMGSYVNNMGQSESNSARQDINSSSEKKYQQKIQTQFESDLTIQEFGIDSLKQNDFPLTVHFDFELKNDPSTELIYLSPLFGEVYKTNPFKSMVRHYPVEMPYKIDETYTLMMEIPVGYKVDEIPKSTRVTYNDKDGIFEYLIQQDGDIIQMRTRLKLNKAFFSVDEYATLRDFFAFVVKKESEQIVFKKIK